MTLQQLIYFQKIAELEHYTRAAEALNTTQPGLSYAMAELEKELNVPLFYRKGRNIKLTFYGDMFLEHVNRALQEIQMGCQEIADQINLERGVVKIGHISSMNRKYIPYIQQRFYQNGANENIKLEFYESPTIPLVEEIKMCKFDVGFGSYVDDPKLNSFPVYKEKLVLIAAKDHALAKRDCVTLEETLGYPYIEYNEKCGIRSDVDQLFREAGVERKISNEYQDNYMIVGMVAAGLGIAVVPEMYGVDYYNVKAIQIEGVNAERGLHMIWLKDRHMTPVCKKFISFVKSLDGEAFI